MQLVIYLSWQVFCDITLSICVCLNVCGIDCTVKLVSKVSAASCHSCENMHVRVVSLALVKDESLPEARV